MVAIEHSQEKREHHSQGYQKSKIGGHARGKTRKP